MEFKPRIGLEIHVELKTESKMFCPSRNDPLEVVPNKNICPVCVGHPGTLPVINKNAVDLVLMTGLALNSKIQTFSKFDRKNYFYPDLPKGYQISQYDKPLCLGGFLALDNKKIYIRRVHLEEDTGKLLHIKNYSLVDFNRAGVPLMELVTEPDISSGQEARRFAQELQLLLRYLGVSDADMEKGQMRVEVNLSLSKKEELRSKKLGTKVEIKNLNSFRSVERAIDHEIKRQSALLKKGKSIVQETRGWNDVKGNTYSQRWKEEAQDYRYFPEPDLLPLNMSNDQIQYLKEAIHELPQEKKERLVKQYHIKENDAEILIQNKDLGEYFEQVVSETEEWEQSGKRNIADKTINQLAVNYLITRLSALMTEKNTGFKNLKITPENFAEFIYLLYNKSISAAAAHEVLAQMFEAGADPSHIVEEKGLLQISSEKELENIIERVIKENEKAVSDFKKGNLGTLQFLVGQIMKETKGKANPEITQELLRQRLQ